jgi:protein nanos 1
LIQDHNLLTSINSQIQLPIQLPANPELVQAPSILLLIPNNIDKLNKGPHVNKQNGVEFYNQLEIQSQKRKPRSYSYRAEFDDLKIRAEYLRKQKGNLNPKIFKRNFIFVLLEIYQFCNFCKKNGEAQVICESHNLKDQNGNTICPVLTNYKCDYCADYGHTKSHCMFKKL